MQQLTIPLRMYTSEVLALARFSMATLHLRRRLGQFPNPIDRGKQDIYKGEDVYRALGLLSDAAPRMQHDPIMAALEKMG